MGDNKINSKNGFSLVELMIVVAVIGILAAIGTVNYKKFQAKARQIEAKSSLNALYVAEVGFFNEWNAYTMDLRNVGFATYGSNLRYATGFGASVLTFLFTHPHCQDYPTGNGAPLEFEGSVDPGGSYIFRWSCGSKVASAQSTFRLPTAIVMDISNPLSFCAENGGLDWSTTVPIHSFCVSTPGSQAFQAIAVGDPNSNVGATVIDGWSIDHTKKISNSLPGIQ